jgi:hypothetical protein
VAAPVMYGFERAGLRSSRKCSNTDARNESAYAFVIRT